MLAKRSEKSACCSLSGRTLVPLLACWARLADRPFAVFAPVGNACRRILIRRDGCNQPAQALKYRASKIAAGRALRLTTPTIGGALRALPAPRKLPSRPHAPV